MPLLSLEGILLFILAAGAGAFARYGCSAWAGQLACKLRAYKQGTQQPSSIQCSVRFPWGVFIVNLLGCFGFGLCMGLGNSSFPLDATERIILFTGFFGSFTTFSTFIFEMYFLWQEREYISCILFSLGQICGGIFLTYMGMYIFL